MIAEKTRVGDEVLEIGLCEAGVTCIVGIVPRVTSVEACDRFSRASTIFEGLSRGPRDSLSASSWTVKVIPAKLIGLLCDSLTLSTPV